MTNTAEFLGELGCSGLDVMDGTQKIEMETGNETPKGCILLLTKTEGEGNVPQIELWMNVVWCRKCSSLSRLDALDWI